MNERMKLVVRLQAGEKMTDLCQEFEISRKTGYKFWDRYKELGPSGLFDESRRPVVSPLRTPDPIRELLLEARRAHPTWGPRKLCASLRMKHPGVRLPSHSTVYGILKQAGLVEPRVRKRRVTPYTDPLAHAKEPNDLWCADFKGQFRMGNRLYCYPLTITDARSRAILACEGLESTRHSGARGVFEQAFREHGLPRAIRTDNGSPFASKAICGLSRLSVWWHRLGVAHERIEPGQPQQNGRHERMHLTLKRETTRPPGKNLLQQQERFDRFVEHFNTERPHQALDDVVPASVYRPSDRKLPDELPPLEYPLHDRTTRVDANGVVYVRARVNDRTPVYLSEVLAGELVGLRQLTDSRWLVTFGDIDLGELDIETRRLEVP